MIANLTSFLVGLHPVLEALVKVSVLFLLGFCAHRLLGRQNRRWRVLAWRAVFLGGLLIPLVQPLAPALKVAVAPRTGGGALLSATVAGELGNFSDEGVGPLAKLNGKGDLVHRTRAVPAADKAPKAQAPSVGTLFLQSIRTLDLADLCVFIWAAGLGVCATLTIRSHRRIARIARGGSDAPAHVAEALRAAVRRLDLAELPEVRVSAEVGGPFLMGFRRPVILLPPQLAAREAADDLPAVFAHELSHIGSRDLLWLAVANWLTSLLWFHPLAWLARHKHLESCEALGDAVAAERVGESAYSGALARVALRMVGPAPSVAGIAMARSPEILRRLSALKRRLLVSPLRRRQVAAFLAMSAVFLCGLAGLRLVYAQEKQAAASQPAKAGQAFRKPLLAHKFRVYQVNKKLSEFPEKEDLSTPESAGAVCIRYCASGVSDRDWQRISSARLNPDLGLASAKNVQVPPEVAQRWLDARILEVRIYRDTRARVISEVADASGKIGYDQRSLALENGRWLNNGHDGSAPSLDEARRIFDLKCGRFFPVSKPVRPAVANPEEHLKTFVQFLKDKGEEPKAFALKALAEYRVVLMGEWHHRPLYWAFYSSLVEDPKFAETVGVIYLELASNHQPLIDKFLSAKKLDCELVIETLRDGFEPFGWPDKAMLDFFVTVWRVNQSLPEKKRLRIVLVDVQRPWEKIQKREDWRAYDVDRDEFMAENVARDLREHAADKRNALFCVGLGHAYLDLKESDGVTPSRSAGSILRKELGPESVYAIIQHGPSGGNWGDVAGRVCLGLFDSAFAAFGNKPVAFPLGAGPFGEQPYDAQSDLSPGMASGAYRDAFNAYLFLGPLEEEVFSPLIPNFYTDEHMKEVDRRYRLMNGKPWHEIYNQDATTAANFAKWMSGSWGQPRKWIAALGPMDAWRHGDKWQEVAKAEKLSHAMERPEMFAEQAKRLFEAIQTADYDHSDMDSMVQRLRAADAAYQVFSYFDLWVMWMCKNFKANPIVSVELGQVTSESRPSREGPATPEPKVHYKAKRRDGSNLEGDLLFEYDPQDQAWFAKWGLDWHMADEAFLDSVAPNRPDGRARR